MDNIFKNRLIELANRSYQTTTYSFTDFLGIAEQSDLLSLEKEISFAGFELFGGYENADRCIARFGNSKEFGYEEAYPIVCLHISPLLKKFADDLSHRDFLGALMNLGIERSTIGDIKVTNKEAYIFCLESIADYIIDNLTKVKHTNIKIELITEPLQISKLFKEDEAENKQIVVSSLRADGVISKVYNLSRKESLDLFQAQKIFINGRLTENNSAQVKEFDVINARGYGKFKIASTPKDTRKGKISLVVDIYS